MNENEKLGQEPAYPNVAFDKDGVFTHIEGEHYGISKRFYAACMAMQGQLAAGLQYNGANRESIISESYKMADELLKKEKL